jgi:hypothetical protein
MTTEAAFNKLMNSEHPTEIMATSKFMPDGFVIRATTNQNGNRLTVSIRDGKVVPGTKRVRTPDELKKWLDLLTMADE